MKLLSVAIVTLLSVICNVLGQQDEAAKSRPREEADNSLRIARIIKGEIWQPLDAGYKHNGIMRRIFADGTQRDYFLTIFPDESGQIPRWQVKGDYLYTVGMAPGSNRMRPILLRALIKDLLEVRTKEEERKMSEVIPGFPSYDMLNLTPLAPPTYPSDRKQEDIERWESPDCYDLLVDDREIVILVITTNDKIDTWVLDSQDAWSSVALDGRQGVLKQWKHIASTTAPFKGRFVTEIEGGRLSLVSETGEIWQSDDHKTFNKLREADDIAPGGNSLIVVDTDQRQIWLGRDSTDKTAGSQHLRLIKGAGNGPSERVLRALRSFQPQSHR